MISVYKIKPAFQKLLQPLLNALHRLGITANQLTIIAILFSFGLGVIVYFSSQYPFFLLLVAIGLLLRMVLNALDGMMARQFDMQSKMGEVLNELGDVVSDLAIFLPFIVFPELNPRIVVLFAVLSIINEYAGILGKAMGGERRYDGPMGKSDRALILGLFCILGYFWKDVFNYSNWIFGIASFLILISTITRIRRSL